LQSYKYIYIYIYICIYIYNIYNKEGTGGGGEVRKCSETLSRTLQTHTDNSASRGGGSPP
jgi:hypothetical protein